jgi:pimeloyl-ACP methyl ester carboxylesterase
MFGSSRAVPDANAVVMDDYAADIHAWAATIRERMGASCVWVLGHSEGGLSALVAARDHPGICGLLLVSTPGRRLGDILREQIAANPANGHIRAQAESIIAQLELGRRVEATTVHPALLPLFRPEVQGFLISALAIDPARLIAEYRGPVLILQGLRDIQVRRADAERLHQARPDANLTLLPDANHVLKSVSIDDLAANLAAYQDTERPLAQGVVETLAAFIKAQNNVR